MSLLLSKFVCFLFFSAISQTQHAESTYKPKWKKPDFESKVRLITDKNHSVAYCHVPKAASTTWMVAFAKNNHVAKYTELLEKLSLHAELLRNYTIDVEKLEETSNIFTFTFIRHPFHRIVSN